LILQRRVGAGFRPMSPAYNLRNAILTPPQHRSYTQFSGFHGVIGGLLVAVKQIMADQEIKLGGVVQLPARVRALAGILLPAAAVA